MKASHPNPAGRAMRSCTLRGKCACRERGRFSRETCEARYHDAVREIINETIWEPKP